jgi:hypothetical protein
MLRKLRLIIPLVAVAAAIVLGASTAQSAR